MDPLVAVLGHISLSGHHLAGFGRLARASALLLMLKNLYEIFFVTSSGISHRQLVLGQFHQKLCRMLAVDVTPYPIVWDDRERQTLFAGFVLATAKAMGIELRWGGDWSMDFEVKDNQFDDLVHFEIVE